MRKWVVFVLALCLAVPVAAGAVPAASGKAPAKAGKHQKKKNAKMSVVQLRKKGEKDAARHKTEMMRREYQLMMEAQQRGMRQRPPQ